MAWTFTTWKTLTGTGGKAAAIMIIAGSIGLLSVPWFQRPPAASYYFTTRDAAEIVVRAGEQETAMRDDLVDEWAPLGFGWSGFADWYGWFPSTNGYFSTNAVGRYVQRRFWQGIESAQGAHFRCSPANYARRRWVDLWHKGGVDAAYDQASPFCVLGTGQTPDDAPYAMHEDWWKTNVYAGATWYPFTNLNYVTAGDLRAVGRAYSAARWTIEYGRSTPHFLIDTQYMYNIGVYWRASATGEVTETFQSLASTAWTALQSAATTPLYSGAIFTGPELATRLPYCRIDDHSAEIYLYETGTNAEPRYRIARLTESVSGQVAGAITVGTNCSVYGIGRPITTSAGNPAQFWHPEYIYTEQTHLVLLPSGDPVACYEFGGSAPVSNAWLHLNPVLAWDGRFAATPYTLLANYPVNAPTASYVATNRYLGWQSVATNAAFAIDWRFTHLTNREAFYP